MKLSIITINYNNLVGLKKTVDSVLSQTWRDFEWIIVDGGSTDGSKEYIETLAQSLSEGTAIDRVQWNVERFSLPGFTSDVLKTQQLEEISDHSSQTSNRLQRLLWCSEPDKGVYNALNKGISQCAGEYVNCMNSGDYFFASNTLESVSRFFKNNDIVYGDWVRSLENRQDFWTFPGPVRLCNFYDNNICHQAMFVNALLLKQKGFDESYHIYADWKRWVEASINGSTFFHVDQIICCFDVSGISYTQKEICLLELSRLRMEFPSIGEALIDSVRNEIVKLREIPQVEILGTIIKKGALPLFLYKLFMKIMKLLFVKTTIL